MSYQADRSPEAAATVLFGLPVGRTRLLPARASQQSGWIVLRVTERQHRRRVRPGRAASRGQARARAIGERLLQPLSEEVGVRVNPRYGVWDPVSMRVVAADAGRRDPAARRADRGWMARTVVVAARAVGGVLPAAAVPVLRAAAEVYRRCHGARRRS